MKPGDRDPEEWVEQIHRFCGIKLRRKGKEFAGPCPVCGGTDRFHVARKAHGRGSMIGCRQCKSSFAEFCRFIWGDPRTDLVPPKRPHAQPRADRQRPDQEFAIRDLDGKLVATHSRWQGRNGQRKRYAWSRCGKPGLGGLAVAALPFYLSEHLKYYDPRKPLFIVEGEPAADALRAADAQVVGTVTGASSHPSEAVWRFLSGFKDCLVWPDLDGPGRKHAQRCAEALATVNPEANIRIVDPEALCLTAPGSDAVEWIEMGEGAEGLGRVISSASPFDSDTCDSRDSCYIGRRKRTSAAIGGESGCEIAPEPTPLAPDREAPFPVEVFPTLLREAAEAIQALTRAPMALCAQSVLAVASVAAQRVADVELPTRQTAPLSLFLLSIAQSGERKSSVDRWATKPLQDEEERQEEQHRERLASHEAALEAWKAEKTAARRNADGDLRERLEELGPEPKPPVQPGLLVGMGTIEGILSMLERQDAVGLFSDEGGSFLTGYAMSRENNRRIRTATVLSSLWDGRPIREERRGGNLRLGLGKRMALHLLVQPIVAKQILTDDEIDGQGLLSRLLIVEPESTIGTRLWQEPPESALVVLQDFTERIRQLLTLDGEPRTLPLSPVAKAAWIDLHNDLESKIGHNGELEGIRSFAAKAPEHAARIAGVMAIFESSDAVDITSLASGEALVKFYLSERVRLSGKPEEPHAEDANRLAQWLEETWSEDWICLSDFLQKGPSRYRKKRPLIKDKLLPLLEAYGHIKGPPRRAEIQGKPRREAYRVIRRV